MTTSRENQPSVVRLIPPKGAEWLHGIFINFPDPWGRQRWLKHRILNAAFLREAHLRLKPGGFLSYKTDHAGYFEATQAILGKLGIFRIVKLTRDLHRSEYMDQNIPTEFEQLFRSKGEAVFFMEAVRAS